MHTILLFGATSILGFNLATLFSDEVIPFTSPGKKTPAVQQWLTLNMECSEWIKAIFDHYQPQVLLYGHAVCDVPKCEARSEEHTSELQSH